MFFLILFITIINAQFQVFIKKSSSLYQIYNLTIHNNTTTYHFITNVTFHNVTTQMATFYSNRKSNHAIVLFSARSSDDHKNNLFIFNKTGNICNIYDSPYYIFTLVINNENTPIGIKPYNYNKSSLIFLNETIIMNYTNFDTNLVAFDYYQQNYYIAAKENNRKQNLIVKMNTRDKTIETFNTPHQIYTLSYNPTTDEVYSIINNRIYTTTLLTASSFSTKSIIFMKSIDYMRYSTCGWDINYSKLLCVGKNEGFVYDINNSTIDYIKFNYKIMGIF